MSYYTTSTLNRPVAFPGTLAEADENVLTHLFFWGDEDVRCGNCDCRPSHVAASYPCGQEPPRETVTSYFDEDGEFVGQEIELDRPKVNGWTPVTAEDFCVGDPEAEADLPF